MKKIKDKKHLALLVDDIIEIKGDAEIAHSIEDDLHLRIIMQFCPLWVKKEIKRLEDADFPRWCA